MCIYSAVQVSIVISKEPLSADKLKWKQSKRKYY